MTEEEESKYLGMPFSRPQIKVFKELFYRMVIILSFLEIILNSLFLFLFGSCTFGEKKKGEIRSLEFGDCDNPKVFLLVLTGFYGFVLALSLLYALGTIKRKYSFLMPYVAVRGVLCVYSTLGTIVLLGEEAAAPFAARTLYVVAFILSFVAVLNGYLYIFSLRPRPRI